MGIIYIATNTINKLQYVGQTTATLNRRKRSGYNKYFSRAIQKYKDKIMWETIEIPEEQLDFFEVSYIYLLNTMYPNGYNFDSGGNKYKHLSDATKEKLSKAAIGRVSPLKGKKRTEAEKRKMSENHADYSGENHPMWGKHQSLESRKKNSESNKDKQYGEKNKNSKLTANNVLAIRELYKTGKYRHIDLAKKFNVAEITIDRIINYRGWKNI